MSASGGSQKRLTDNEVDPATPQGLLFQIEPAWSPDAGTIAFVSKRSGNLWISTRWTRTGAGRGR